MRILALVLIVLIWKPVQASSIMSQCRNLLGSVESSTSRIFDPDLGDSVVAFYNALEEKEATLAAASVQGRLLYDAQSLSDMRLLGILRTQLAVALVKLQDSRASVQTFRAENNTGIDSKEIAELLEIAMNDEMEAVSTVRSMRDKTLGVIAEALLGNVKTSVVEIHPANGVATSTESLKRMKDMYIEYASRMGWNATLESGADDSKAGYTLHIAGAEAYSHLVGESGIHRIEIQNGSHVHTHRFDVLVYPALESQRFVFNERDVTFQPAKSSGAGGQHVNRTESAVHATHVPTGLSVFAQEHREQPKNKMEAVNRLRQMVYERFLTGSEVARREAAVRAARMTEARSSPYVRTYDFQRNHHEAQRLMSGHLELATRASMRVELGHLFK